MLVLKKISVKKLAIYSAIIIMMIAGTGLMLYQNYKLTSGGDSNGQSEGMMPLEAELPASIPAGMDEPAAVDPAAAVTPKINNLGNNGGLDLTIFSSEKFKQLQENVETAKEQPELGKRDPFAAN